MTSPSRSFADIGATLVAAAWLVFVWGALLASCSSNARADTPPPPPPVVAPAPPAPPAPPLSADDTRALHHDIEHTGLTTDVIAKLSSDDLANVLLAQRASNGHSAEDILVPIAFFLMIAGIVWLRTAASLRRDRERHEMLRLIIEKGAGVPPELFLTGQPPRNDLRRGILLVALGLGLSAMMAGVADDPGTWTLGLVPALLGAGYLFAWKYDTRAARRTTDLNPPL